MSWMRCRGLQLLSDLWELQQFPLWVVLATHGDEIPWGGSVDIMAWRKGSLAGARDVLEAR